MPATVLYRSGYPSLTAPLNSSVSFGTDGLVTVTATFLVAASDVHRYLIGERLNASLFSCLNAVGLQEKTLIVSARNTEKRGGLTSLNLTCLGARNPPVLEQTVEVGSRSFSKARTYDDDEETITLTFDFDYRAESISVTTVQLEGAFDRFEVPQPQVVQIYNRRGTGVISLFGDPGPIDTARDRLIAQPRILRSENNTRLVRGLVRRTVTDQFIYE